MKTRREFLAAAGSLTAAGLAGLAAPAWLAGHTRVRGPLAVVRMTSDATGARVAFQPAGLHLAPGDRVRWVLEAGAHSTTAYHPANGGAPARLPAGAAPWDSGILFRTGDAFERAFEVPGVYDYFCLPHEAAGMVGRLVVGTPGADFEIPPWVRADAGPRRPDAAAFPSVCDILAESVRTQR